MTIHYAPDARYTYRAPVPCSEDRIEVANAVLESRELFRVQRNGLTDKADAAKRKINIIARWELVFYLQIFVKMLSNSRIGSIGTNENLSMVGRVV